MSVMLSLIAPNPRSEKSPVTSKRLSAIIEHLTFAVFEYTCRGLYEDHKFLFTLLLALKIDLSRDRVKHQVKKELATLTPRQIYRIIS